jgi:asparagine synthase (glutamine-hydrolysing)
MCGIVGYVGSKGEEAIVRRMADRIVHRGPDGHGYFVDDTVALGARRLSIIDLAGSNQPIFNEDGTVVTVFNGEIYNYRDLRTLLQQKGHQLRTSGDTETLVHLYEEYGAAAVHLLRGMFGYAVWDRPRRRLVLARDRVGIKPMYYAEVGDRLVFGSEIKSILAVPGVDRRIDPDALNAYLTLQYVPSPATMLRGVRKLPAGHILTWENGRTQIEQYWDVVYNDDPPPISERAAVEQLRGLLEESVELHKISDVEVAVLLSGGIDSTAVTALMSRSGQRTRSFTVGFAGSRIGETEQARKVAGHLGTEHHELLIGGDLADVLPKLAWYQDEPVADAAAVPTYYICKHASEYVKVVLTGEGGDELLGGYPRYRWLHRSEQILSAPLVGPVAASLGGPVAAVLPASLGARARAVFAGGSVPDRHVRWIANMDDELKRRLVTPDLARAMSSGGPSEAVSAWMRRSGASTAFSGLMYSDFKMWLPDNILAKMDRMSMAASVEGRVPILDHKVVEFAAMLPYRLKLSGRQTKKLLREAVRGLLDPALLERPKTAFRVPVREWLRGPLSALVQDTFGSRRMRERGLFDPTALDLLAAAGSGVRPRSDPAPRTGVRPGSDPASRTGVRPGSDPDGGDPDGGRAGAVPVTAVWNVLWFELWCQQYLDADPAADR